MILAENKMLEEEREKNLKIVGPTRMEKMRLEKEKAEDLRDEERGRIQALMEERNFVIGTTES